MSLRLVPLRWAFLVLCSVLVLSPRGRQIVDRFMADAVNRGGDL